ncbi:MAG: NUDIX hydrolase [Chitinophagaceae bacterium]|nr:MAG: NUDIX hydrolase [Chitinophagaceae bacterium]
MNRLEIFEKRSNAHYETSVPHISVDCVVFGFHASSLKVLLVKMKDGPWGLPGGYLRKTEDLEDAAQRILNERTGAENIFLEQFKTFGKQFRSESALDFLPEGFWHKQRFVSVGFYALVEYSTIVPRVDDISEACEWKDVEELPDLMMDHGDIFKGALSALHKQINYKPIGYNLLPKEFTLPQLQKLYEIILGKKLYRGSFQRRILGYDILIRHNKTMKIGAHRSPILYSFDLEKYNAAMEEGLVRGW